MSARWLDRTASPEAGRLDAMERELHAHYPGANIEVSHHEQPGASVVSVSVARDGRGWISTRIGASTLADAVAEMARVVAGLCGSREVPHA